MAKLRCSAKKQSSERGGPMPQQLTGQANESMTYWYKVSKFLPPTSEHSERLQIIAGPVLQKCQKYIPHSSRSRAISLPVFLLLVSLFGLVCLHYVMLDLLSFILFWCVCLFHFSSLISSLFILFLPPLVESLLLLLFLTRFVSMLITCCLYRKKLEAEVIDSDQRPGLGTREQPWLSGHQRLWRPVREL